MIFRLVRCRPEHIPGWQGWDFALVNQEPGDSPAEEMILCHNPITLPTVLHDRFRLAEDGAAIEAIYRDGGGWQPPEYPRKDMPLDWLRGVANELRKQGHFVTEDLATITKMEGVPERR